MKLKFLIDQTDIINLLKWIQHWGRFLGETTFKQRSVISELWDMHLTIEICRVRNEIYFNYTSSCGYNCDIPSERNEIIRTIRTDGSQRSSRRSLRIVPSVF